MHFNGVGTAGIYFTGVAEIDSSARVAAAKAITGPWSTITK
jgi:hypothetical protein